MTEHQSLYKIEVYDRSKQVEVFQQVGELRCWQPLFTEHGHVGQRLGWHYERVLRLGWCTEHGYKAPAGIQLTKEHVTKLYTPNIGGEDLKVARSCLAPSTPDTTG